MAEDPYIAYTVETSGDGATWRRVGNGWVEPGEPLLVHGTSRYLRFRRRADPPEPWSDALERTSSDPMALLDLDKGVRTDLMPGKEHEGLPVLLPGGEVGRLMRFVSTDDGEEWTYAVEFRGARRDRG